MTQAQATRIQHELLPISKGIPNRDPYLEYGIWILPFDRGGTILNVFLEDRNLMTETDHARAKRDASENFKRALGRDHYRHDSA
jgi:hypothetical protein